jgi:hypothetical protein
MAELPVVYVFVILPVTAPVSIPIMIDKAQFRLAEENIAQNDRKDSVMKLVRYFPVLIAEAD